MTLRPELERGEEGLLQCLDLFEDFASSPRVCAKGSMFT